MSSDLIQRANLRRVKDGVLARAIMTMDEIEKAIVQVVEPRNGFILHPDEHPSASVMIVTRGGRTISRETVEAIQARLTEKEAA